MKVLFAAAERSPSQEMSSRSTAEQSGSGRKVCKRDFHDNRLPPPRATERHSLPPHLALNSRFAEKFTVFADDGVKGETLSTLHTQALEFDSRECSHLCHRSVIRTSELPNRPAAREVGWLHAAKPKEEALWVYAFGSAWMQISFLLPVRLFSLYAAANVIEIKCFILRGRHDDDDDDQTRLLLLLLFREGRPEARSLRWMGIKGGAKKEASQWGSQEGRGRCRKDHFDGHLETIQLCCGRTN